LVSDQEICHIVRTRAPADASRELVVLARERGGPDNITVQVARIAGNAAGSQPSH
jgi:serine/threonine protein phosphatase PrpC